MAKAALLQRPGAARLCRTAADEQQTGNCRRHQKSPRRIASARVTPASVDDAILPVFCPTDQPAIEARLQIGISTVSSAATASPPFELPGCTMMRSIR